jgi:hypothetical protein
MSPDEKDGLLRNVSGFVTFRQLTSPIIYQKNNTLWKNRDELIRFIS